MTFTDLPPHVLVFAAGALLALLGPPLLNRLWVHLTRRRALPEWRAFAGGSPHPTTPPEVSSSRIEFASEHPEGSVRVEGRVIIRFHRWRSWETHVRIEAPDGWPSGVELYGRRAIRAIAGFRNRIEIDADFDRVVLVRRTQPESVDQARGALGDRSLRGAIRSRFEAEPLLMVRHGRIELVRRGLSDRGILQADIERVATLHALLRPVRPRYGSKASG